ncbi:MAG: J domain-containing protein [Desulfuromonadales bacterium]|nr:J domain-containing protein [Desulfuromonadales bacterium]
MSTPSETALFDACRTLFGSEVNLSLDFLSYLQPGGAKSAFRNQAKANHPDYFADSAPGVRQQQTERFREILQAYDLISDFLEHRKILRTPRPSQHRAAQASTYRPGKRPSRTQAKRSRDTQSNPVPWIALEFGMYAYYKGKVSYHDLVEALVWQRRQRPIIGEVAKKWGWLTESQIKSILSHRGQSFRFGKKAVELGYLKEHQVDVLLQHQRSAQQRIGRYFIEKGLMTEAEADAFSNELKAHNRQVEKKKARRAQHS